MSLFEGFLGEDGSCFGLYFGFSLFEEIENAFVRSFLQGGCLKSAVLDMSVYCELTLGSESDPRGDGGSRREREAHYDEIYHNWYGDSDCYFDNDFCSCFNDYSDYGSHSRFNDFLDRGSVYSRDFVFGGSNGIENGKMSRNVYEGGDHCGGNYGSENMSGSERRFSGIMEIDLPGSGIFVSSDDRSFGMDLAVNGLSGGILSVNGKERISPSLFLNVYKEVDLKTFSDLLLTERSFDVSLNREGYYYSNVVGSAEGYFDFSEAHKFGEDSGRRRNIFIGGAGGRVYDLSENDGYAVSAAGVIELHVRSEKGCKADNGCFFECGFDFGYSCELGGRYVFERCFVDRDCRCEPELRFARSDCGLKAWDRICENDFSADIGFLLNSGAERIEKQVLVLRNEKSEPEKAGLLFEQEIEGSLFVQGIEDFGTGFYPDCRAVLLKNCFDFMQERVGFLQGKTARFSAFDISGLSAEFQRTELLLDNNVKAGLGRLGKAAEGCGADIFLNAEEKNIGMESGGIPLWEDELFISSEEVRKIRKAILPDSSVSAKPIMIGSDVIVNGRLYGSSYGDAQGQMRTNYHGKVNFINLKGTHPYHITTPAGLWQGWVTKESVRAFV